MSKILIGTVVGVFIGAFAAELLRRKRPETFARIERKASEVADAVLEELGSGGRAPELADDQA